MVHHPTGKVRAFFGATCLGAIAMTMTPAIALDRGGDINKYRPGGQINKTVEKGVTVWRPKARPIAAVTAPRQNRKNTGMGAGTTTHTNAAPIPKLAGNEQIVIKQNITIQYFEPNENFAVGKLRVSGFYSGRGRSTNPVRGFYSGKRRIRPSTTQGFYSGYRRNYKRKFPSQRPNGRRAAPLPPGEYAF